jgi:hypothetical protein
LVRPYGPKLIQLYWQIVHAAYPILYKTGFMEQYNETYRNIPAGLLGAVYLAASPWWSYDTELSLKTLPNIAELRRITLSIIQGEFHRPRLSSVEAMLLFLQCKPEIPRPETPLTSDHTFARGLTSQLLAIAEAVGLHIDPSAWSIPEWERSNRKRISWALYMQDKWTALAYGRPSHISELNWSVSDLTAADVMEEEGIARNPSQPGSQSCFLQLFGLTKILSEVLSTFFTVKNSAEQDTEKLLNQARPLFRQLASWRESSSSSSPALHASDQRKLSSGGKSKPVKGWITMRPDLIKCSCISATMESLQTLSGDSSALQHLLRFVLIRQFYPPFVRLHMMQHMRH